MRKIQLASIRLGLPLASLLSLVFMGDARAQSNTCPNTIIQNLHVTSYSPPKALGLSWNAVPGINCDCTVTYDVFEANAAGYCGPFNYSMTGKTSQTAYTASFCPAGTNCPALVKAVFVRVSQCPNILSDAIVVDDLPSPSAPSLSGRVSAPGQVTLTMTLPNDKAFFAFYRSVNGGAYQQASSLFFCPDTRDVTDSNLPDGTYKYKLVAYTDSYQNGVSSNEVTLTLSTSCPTPGAPSYSVQSQLKTNSGRSLVLDWDPAPGAQAGATYVVEVSRGQNFVNFDYRTTTPLTSAIVPAALSSVDYPFFCRVRAVQPCGAVGPNNMVVQCTGRGTPAVFDVTSSGLAFVSAPSSPLNPGEVRFRNIGAQTGSVTVFSNSGFVDISPSSRSIDPGQEGVFTVTPKASLLTTVGGYSGLVNANSSQGETFALPVSLVVSAPYPDDGTRGGTKVVSSASRLTFSAPTGQNPAPQQITLSFPNVVRAGPVFLTASVGPGGSWLVLPSNLPGRLDPNVATTLSLSIDRSKRSSKETTTPLRTLLKLRVVGATEDDATVIEVVDTEPLNTSSGAGGRGEPAPVGGQRAALAPLVNAPTDGTSIIVPVVVSAVGANNSAFYTDGWLRNEGALGLSVDLFFTPEGKDGLTDSSVVKANINVPSGKTQRLSDVLSSMLKSGGSGQLELRSPLPGALTVRATAEAITGGDPTLRFGTEIPVVSYGSGLGLGQGTIVLPGISDDAKNRANLIVSETSGAAATISIDLYDANGGKIGSVAPNPTVPAYGKVQFNRIVSTVTGGTLTGGSAVITVVSGSGKVAAVATVIDNKTNSFSALSGDIFPASGGGLARPMPELAGTPALVIPTVARVYGAANTLFQTSMSVVNGTATPASLSMTYNYIDKNTGATNTTTRTVTIPARGALSQAMGADVLGSLFGLPGETYGWIRVDGDVGRITASAAINAQVDPNDASKGVKSAQVKGVSSSSSALARAGDGLRVFAGGEKSTQKRTNLILEEIDGLACDVRVRITNGSGDAVGEKTYSLSPNQYLQINDVFGSGGLGIGDGPFQDMKISAEVLTGSGRLVSFVTVNDNISKNPEIFLLGPQGPPTPGGSIGF